MGSGLILLVIVGAWLAVLVPMALRSSDVANALGSVDKFHDAMRVLSRRDARAAAREAGDDVPPDPPGGGEPAPVPYRRSSASSPEAARARATAAARRVKVLVALVALAVLTLVGAVVGPLWLLAPHLLVDLLLCGFVVHLRRLAVARAERDWRAAMAARAAAAPRRTPERVVAPAVRHPVHVAGVPDRMPPRPLPLGASVPAQAAPAEQVAAAVRGAQGEAWSPVPVPIPTYLTAPTAPRRVVDLTRPGAYADGLAAAEREVGIVDEGPQLDEILERRRAVNDW